VTASCGNWRGNFRTTDSTSTRATQQEHTLKNFVIMDLWRRIVGRLRPLLESPVQLDSWGENGVHATRNQALGALGERLAVRYLRKQGMKVLYRNFRAPGGGEVDIVCRDGDCLVFVEVKTRSSAEFGRPADAVDEAKRELISRGAIGWLRLLGFPEILLRFDVVEVLASEGEIPLVNRIENCFQLPESSYP